MNIYGWIKICYSSCIMVYIIEQITKERNADNYDGF
jgi:hypothetical protein